VFILRRRRREFHSEQNSVLVGLVRGFSTRLRGFRRGEAHSEEDSVLVGLVRGFSTRLRGFSGFSCWFSGFRYTVSRV
jgi:hypothetical protein